MPRSTILLLVTASLAQSLASARAGDWGQFHGPNATGRPDVEAPLPSKVGTDTNVVWKVPLASGISSPAVVGERVFVTGFRDAKLLTIALDRRTGATLWEAQAPYEKLEAFHSTGSPAQSSPASDGERVVSFFGSCGLFCYDIDGKLLWRLPMGPFHNDFGAGSSPIIVGDRVILCQDHDTDSFLASIDKRTGAVIWKVDRSEFPRNYATPVIWTVAGRRQIVVAATLRIAAYDFDTGAELWTVRGVSRIINMTPVVGDDGILYAACWSPGGDETNRITAAPFAEVVKAHDANANGTLEKDEAPSGTVSERFTQIDRDKNGQITRDEYDSMRRVFESARNMLLAIRPGGSGDITESHVLWKFNRLLPYCPSPVVYRGNLYMVKDGGIFSVVEAATGRSLRQTRLTATGGYFSSPVAGDGKVFCASQPGQISIVSAGPDGDELSTADLGETIHATPAIANGRIYVRTSGHLYCFGEK